MAFTSLSLAAAQALLAARLADPGFVHFTATELTLYLQEALRTWQAFTGSTHATGVFNLVSVPTPQAFYDLSTLATLQRAYTIPGITTFNLLEYHLVEAITPASAIGGPPPAWTGTLQFNRDDLVNALQERRDRFLAETGAVLTHALLPLAPPPPTGRMTLAEATLALNRLAWNDNLSHVITPLRRDDEWGLTHFSPAWVQNPSTPHTYSVSVTNPLRIQLAPPPLASGVVDALVILAGGVPDLTLANGTLGVPDDWVWVVKFGALADLLSREGLAYDPQRAAYCEARWAHGVTMAKAASVVLTARINDVPCRIDTVAHADTFMPTWQTFPGIPRKILLAGHNVLAVTPPPAVPITVGPWAVTVDYVPNMPVPVLAADILQMSLDAFDVILDYAQHLAIFKLGAEQLEASQALLDRFLKAAGTSIDRRALWQPNRTVPVAPLPDNDWAPGTVSSPVGVT